MPTSASTLQNLFSKLELWVIKPLQADVRKHTKRNHFIPFVVFSVLIDNLASIRYSGEIPDTPEKSFVGKRYREFIKQYMPAKYKKHRQELYADFRCKLVHGFQLNSFDIRQLPATRKHHLTKVNGGNTCLHSGEFLKDLISAFKKVKKDMVGPKADPKIVKSFEKTDFRDWMHDASV